MRLTLSPCAAPESATISELIYPAADGIERIVSVAPDAIVCPFWLALPTVPAGLLLEKIFVVAAVDCVEPSGKIIAGLTLDLKVKAWLIAVGLVRLERFWRANVPALAAVVCVVPSGKVSPGGKTFMLDCANGLRV